MDRLKTIAALREIADLLEAHPEMTWWMSDLSIMVCTDTREDVATFARAVGSTKKQELNRDTLILRHCTPSGGELWARVQKESVCEKIVTKKTLPPEPERIVPALPEREVEEVSWKCGSILAAAE